MVWQYLASSEQAWQCPPTSVKLRNRIPLEYVSRVQPERRKMLVASLHEESVIKQWTLRFTCNMNTKRLCLSLLQLVCSAPLAFAPQFSPPTTNFCFPLPITTGVKQSKLMAHMSNTRTENNLFQRLLAVMKWSEQPFLNTKFYCPEPLTQSKTWLSKKNYKITIRVFLSKNFSRPFKLFPQRRISEPFKKSVF